MPFSSLHRSGRDRERCSRINVLVTAQHAVSGNEGRLRIAAAQTPVLHVLRLVGIDALITCHPTLEQALEP
ncbi:hypothetical protein [Streptomyces sp. NPDC054962]